MKRRTWQWFEDRRRPPSEYEELTVGLQWHTDPTTQTDIGSWSTDSTALVNVDWDDFRDPARLYYRTYITMQNQSESELDGVMRVGTATLDPDRLASEWVQAAQTLIAGVAFAEWGIAMVNQHVQRFCLSATLAAAAQLQVMDKFRHAERALEWTATILGSENSDEDPARQAWMRAPELQPLRRYVEQVLTTKDWGECVAAANIALDGHLQPFLHGVYLNGGRAYGDFVAVGLGNAFWVDTEREFAWNAGALTLAAQADPANANTIRGWLDHWGPAADEAVSALAAAHPLDGLSASALEAARAHYRDLVSQLGVTSPLTPA